MSLDTKSAEFVKGFEGFTPTAMWDVNAWRIGHGSDTLTLPDGTYRKVKPGDTTTRELAQKDLARRLNKEFIPKAKATIGPAYWDKLPEQAKMALISIAYNYGNVTKQAIINAARSGNMALLSKAIIESTYNDNAGILRERRAKEAALVMSAAKQTTEFAKKHAILIVFALVLLIVAILLLVYRKQIAGYISKK